MGLTRKGFEAWLRAKAKDAVVGRRFKEHCCPLATYLREQGYTHVEVGCINYLVDNPEGGVTILPLRTWAERFVMYVDEWAYAPIQGDEHVTAAEARTILRRV